MYCVNCGKELSDEAAFCPECGAQQGVHTPAAPCTESSAPAAQQPVSKAPYNTVCIVGLIVSGISLFLNFWGIVGIVGTVLSVIGLIGCQRKGENVRVCAISGIAIGAFSILYGFFSLI